MKNSYSIEELNEKANQNITHSKVSGFVNDKNTGLAAPYRVNVYENKDEVMIIHNSTASAKSFEHAAHFFREGGVPERALIVRNGGQYQHQFRALWRDDCLAINLGRIEEQGLECRPLSSIGDYLTPEERKIMNTPAADLPMQTKLTVGKPIKFDSLEQLNQTVNDSIEHRFVHDK